MNKLNTKHKQMIKFLLGIIVFIPLITNAQITQIGSDIDGFSANENSGTSIALSSDGQYLVVGAPYNAGGGTSRGQVRVYRNVSGSWVQQGSSINGVADFDEFGTSVAISDNGTRIAVGAPYNAGGGTERGQVRIFQFSSGSWSQLGASLNGEADGDRSGTSVAMSSTGNRVVIGAPLNAGGGSQRGHARVYQYVFSWGQQGGDIDGEADTDEFGSSVSISDDGLTIAVGSIWNNGNGSFRGHVRVYGFASSVWTQRGADIDGESNSDFSGTSISLSNDGLTIAIGASGNAGGGSARGHVRVYNFQSPSWVQLGSDIDGEANNDGSGVSVSLSGNGQTVLIGAPYNAGGGTQRGHFRVYNYSSSTWSQLFSDVDGEANGDWFGYRASISADGSTLAVSGIRNDGSFSNAGHVRVYSLITPAPEINVKGNNITILDGNNATSYADSTDFGSVALGGNIKRRFKIFNTGTATLNISSITMSGAYFAEYSVSQIPSSIAPNDSASFMVTFTPTILGSLLAYVNINNSDPNEGIYNYTITGTGLSAFTCNLSANLETNPGSYTSNQIGTDGNYTCYCDANNRLLLALDLTSSGAVIPNNGVSIQIGSTYTTAWTNAGGIITNPGGGAIFNRKWNVSPTTQPTGTVRVKFPFTALEYDSVRARLIPMGSNLSSVTNLQMYKLSSGVFSDPHALGATGTIIMNGSTATLNNWVYAAMSSNHSAEFLVNSFSGGGGGAGAGAIPLPIKFENFTANKVNNNNVQLSWIMNIDIQPLNYQVEKSIDGINFETIANIDYNTSIKQYQYNDFLSALNSNVLFYKITCTDLNGKKTFSEIKKVNLFETNKEIKLYPNPMNQIVNLELPSYSEKIDVNIMSLDGKIIQSLNYNNSKNIELNLSELSSGNYNIQLIINNTDVINQLIIKN